MIEKRTVFILGAGASCPYGFPTGSELVERICKQFIRSSGELLLSLAVRDPSKPDRRAEAYEFVGVLSKSRVQSIDLFLSRNPEFITVGKIAIILAILSAEAASLFRGEMPKEKERVDWYTDLLRNLTDGLVRKQDFSRFGDNKVSFITFNYDRSLEHFLYESLLNSFHGVASEDIRQVLQRIPIVHVYGYVAPLDWQEPRDGRPKIPYRVQANAADVLDLANNLYVIYDERCHPVLDKARELISQAERLFFLGFGYANENLEALGLSGVLKRSHQIFGTALGLTDKEREDIWDGFVQGLQRNGNESAQVGERVEVRDCDCVALLREFL
jgi:hypothetical protein